MRLAIEILGIILLVAFCYGGNVSERRRIEQKKELYECREQVKELQKEISKQKQEPGFIDGMTGRFISADEVQQHNLDILYKVIYKTDPDTCYILSEYMFKAVRPQLLNPYLGKKLPVPSGIDD